MGGEASHRLVEYQPLRRVHQTVFGVLTMEAEPVGRSCDGEQPSASS